MGTNADNPANDGPDGDLGPGVEPDVVRRIEAALDDAAGIASPTASGWDEVGRRVARRRATQRRTQIAAAAAVVLLVLAGVVITGRGSDQSNVGTVDQPDRPTTTRPPDDGSLTVAGSAVLPPTTTPAPVEAAQGTTIPVAVAPTSSPPTAPTTTTTTAVPPTTLVTGPPVAIEPDPDPLVRCATAPGSFRPSALEAPADAEQGTDPLGTALRTELERTRFNDLPDAGWRLVSATETTALFIAGHPPWAKVFAMRFADDRWQFVSSGDCPALRIATPEGEGWAQWTIGARPPEDHSELTVFVDDPSCSGTMSAGDRILTPRIDERDDQIIITFTVTPLPPGTYPCQPHAATPYTVTLQKPLGNRPLFDGGSFPAVLRPQP